MTSGVGAEPAHLREAQLRAILDSIPARVAMLDRGRRHRYLNREYAQFIGLPPERILGRTSEDVIGSDAFSLLQPLGDRALAGETVRWDGWLSYANQPNLRYVQNVYVPHRDESGNIDGYFVFARDLTALKRSEQQLSEQLAALRASEALNAAVIDSALDCVVVIDEAGLVLAFNAAAERTFGYTRAQTLGQPIGDLIVPPRLRARHAAGLERYIATGKAHVLGRRVELEGMRADGACFPIELTVTEVSLPGRRLFTAYLRDLTAARQAEADIQRHREALDQSEKMAAFGSLLAGVAHELNNPLSIVLGNALMLEEDARDEGVAGLAERAATIQLAAERCVRIVRSFLAMARQRKAQLRPVGVRALVEGALALLSYGMRADGIDVEIQVPADLSDAMGEPDQLQQILANLLVNARQALEGRTPPRRVRVAARTEAGFVCLTVADNGPGVPAGLHGRVFDPFFTTKPVGAGTGIGLSVSRGIAEAHGGTLALADPGPDGGACFELRLPCAAAECAPGGGAPSSPAREYAPVGPALVVDDEPEVAAVLAHMLTAQGFHCDVAGGGREALALLGEHDYAAIFSDLHMPEIDGPGLFAWLQTHKPHLSGRMAFVTGDTLGPAVEDFLARAGRPVLDKPFAPEDVRRVIAELGPPR